MFSPFFAVLKRVSFSRVMSSALSVKLHLSSDDIRRFAFERDAGLDGLRRYVAREYWQEQQFDLAYADDEGDRISLRSVSCSSVFVFSPFFSSTRSSDLTFQATTATGARLSGCILRAKSCTCSSRRRLLLFLQALPRAPRVPRHPSLPVPRLAAPHRSTLPVCLAEAASSRAGP